MGVGEQHPSKESGAATGFTQKRHMLWWPLPALQACLLEVPLERFIGHWQVVGRKQEAGRAFTPTWTTLGSLEHYFL